MTIHVTGEWQSFIRTGGEWVTKDRTSGDRGWNRDVYTPWYSGDYVGGTREPGRVGKMAPACVHPLTAALFRDREGLPFTPAPRYDTTAEVTKRAREFSPGDTWLPLKGEELGAKFLKSLRATGPGWERDNGLGPIAKPWGKAPWKTADVVAHPGAAKLRPNPMTPQRDLSGLKILAHGTDTPSGKVYWFEVVGDLDSCGHRHPSRIEAGACKRAMIADHVARSGALLPVDCDTITEYGMSQRLSFQIRVF